MKFVQEIIEEYKEEIASQLTTNKLREMILEEGLGS